MEKQRIVTAHNKVRQMVATGQIQGQPAATNMRQDKSLIIGIDPVSLPKLRTPNRGLLRDYEPSDGPSFQALLYRELVWDEELAVVAQRWADQCMPGHDHRRNVGM